MLDPGHRGYKPIAARGDRLNAASFRSPLIEYPAECRDLDRQIGILDNGPSPDGRHDLLFRDEIAGALDNYAENIEGSQTDGDRDENAAFIAPRQAVAPPIEAKFLEQKNVGRGEHDVFQSSPRGRAR